MILRQPQRPWLHENLGGKAISWYGVLPDPLMSMIGFAQQLIPSSCP